MKYDVIVIGAGPGGMAASIYTSRSNLKTLIIDKDAPGGKMVTTFKVENYPGFTSISGPDLSMSMYNQLISLGVEHKFGEVINIKTNGNIKYTLKLKDGLKIEAKQIIIATGMISKIPNIPRIQELNNKGIFYCAICDGPLYKGEVMGVIGGGNSAVEEASFLSSVAKEVHVFIVGGSFSADAKEVDILKSKNNVIIHMRSEIKELFGSKALEGIKYIQNHKEKLLDIKAIFPYIGYKPIANFAKELNITNKQGFILTNEHMQTSKSGIYAIGDIREKEIRQITTATSDGTIAAKHIINKL